MGEMNVLAKMFDVFPSNEIFPALDLVRLVILLPDASERARQQYWETIFTKADELCKKEENLQGPAAVAIPMLTLRLYTNAFKGGTGSQQAVIGKLETALSVAELFVKSTNKNVRLSVATLLYNIAFYMNMNRSAVTSLVVPNTVISIINTILDLKTYETEAIHRTLIALGTYILCNPSAKDAANSLYFSSKVEMVASPHTAQVKATAKEVYNALQ